MSVSEARTAPITATLTRTGSEYSDTLRCLRYAAGPDVQYGSPHEDYPLSVDGTGTIYGSTPGYDGTHDLGLAYCVTVVEDEDEADCPGHESLRGDLMGASFYCDGTCTTNR
jgi:hypothetical protein